MEKYLNYLCKVWDVILLIELHREWKTEEEIESIMKQLKEDN